MGGLVARYYLRYGPRPLPDDGSLPPLDWAGARNVARVVLVGTPNAGSVLAMQDLIDGHRLARVLPEYPAAVLGTMPAIYQLLPRSRHGALVDAADGQRKIDLDDPALWRDMKWGLASPDQDNVLALLLETPLPPATYPQTPRSSQPYNGSDFRPRSSPGGVLHESLTW